MTLFSKKHVADDKVLGKFARFQNDLFRRVREGSLDPQRIIDLAHAEIECNIKWLQYRVNVNYDSPHIDLVECGGYSPRDSNLSLFASGGRWGFHSQEPRRVSEIRTIHLVNFGDQELTPEDIRERLHDSNLRPATLSELLSLGLAHPNAQVGKIILSLDPSGNVWDHVVNRPVGYLGLGGLEPGTLEVRPGPRAVGVWSYPRFSAAFWFAALAV